MRGYIGVRYSVPQRPPLAVSNLDLDSGVALSYPLLPKPVAALVPELRVCIREASALTPGHVVVLTARLGRYSLQFLAQLLLAAGL